MKYQQQGDVLIFAINESELPTDLEDLKTNVIQEGEHTGHAHRMYDGKAEVFQSKETKVKYLKVLTPVNLRHEEHKAFVVDPGIYRIGIVREVDPFEDEIRAVKD